MSKLDLDPDGVLIRIRWKKFDIGSSVFIPCLETTDCKKQLRAIAKRLDYTFKMVAKIEGKKCGVRIWRES
jgi:hypothetical protein